MAQHPQPALLKQLRDLDDPREVAHGDVTTGPQDPHDLSDRLPAALEVTQAVQAQAAEHHVDRGVCHVNGAGVAGVDLDSIRDTLRNGVPPETIWSVVGQVLADPQVDPVTDEEQVTESVRKERIETEGVDNDRL